MGKKSILILGAGRSSSALISYLLEKANNGNWHVTVGDFFEQAAKDRVGSSGNGTAIRFNIEEEEASAQAIQAADIVISLLPAAFHPRVAKLCLYHKKHLFTASYISDEMKSFHEEAKQKDLLFMNECGLDPGIDHMTAMEVMDRIRDEGGKMISFESFAGGLIAPTTDPSNPWRYKFTWNPRNIVIAGQGTAKFIQEGQYKFIPYQQLFQRTTYVHIPGYGDFEGYANRDSLKYISNYKLDDVKTMLRGTLRNKGFCSAWNILGQLGCTDDSYPMERVDQMTHREFLNTFLPYDKVMMLEDKLMNRFKLDQDGPEMERLRWSGLFEREPIGLNSGTPAQVLEHILNKKWKLEPTDKDMVVMWHRFIYSMKGETREIQSHLVALGDDSIQTAMAKGVGLPLAIGTRLFIEGKIKDRGVAMPLSKEVYRPILDELRHFGISMQERNVVDEQA
ncbi:MAG: saccharopine dehydrogenase NADP-binding domain-containing protein [Cyclobacteriaceae bacterium]|nr:saccharopine dehydrogenase NADP-binding domain-containing protein [Cyclobacteriaceae bacterium]